MPNIGKYTSIWTANTAQFSRGMSRAEKSMKSFGGGVTRVGGKLRGLTAGLLGVGSAAGAAFLIKNELEKLRTVGLVADKLGISVENLIGLQFAAEQVNIGISRLNVGLQRFGRRIGEAAVGTGELKALLKEIGLDPVILTARGLDQAFFDLADKVKAMTNPFQKLRTAFKAFDSEGVDLVNLMRLGARGIKEFITEAKELGFVFSRIEIQQAIQAIQALNRARRAIGGVFARVGIAIAPILEAAANAFSNLVKSLSNKDIIGFIRKTFAFIAEVMGGIADVFLIDIPLGLARIHLKLAGFFASPMLKQILEADITRLESAPRRSTQFRAFVEGIFSDSVNRAAAFVTGISDPFGRGIVPPSSKAGKLSFGQATERELGIIGGRTRFGSTAANPVVKQGAKMISVLELIKRYTKATADALTKGTSLNSLVVR